MSGNKALLARIAESFGSQDDTDCRIVFSLEERPESDPDAEPSTLSTFGDPLPAHQFVLRRASERFRTQLARWGPNSGKRKAGSDEPIGPELRVPLSSEAEVSSARAAVAFAYTGRIQATSVREVLEVLRQGNYLQIEGCAGAAAEVLTALITSSADGSSSGSGSGMSDSSNPETAALELFKCYEMWPTSDTEAPGFSDVVAAAKPLLVLRYPDALSVLNDPALRAEMLQLPAAAIEGLLESDDFGTDTESTVLLLLATWMRANFAKTDEPTRERLCRLVRLVQLSEPYRSWILFGLALDYTTKPGRIGWFAITVMEAAFVSQFASADQEVQERIRSTCKLWDVTLPTYSTKKRQGCHPADYDWHVTQEALRQAVEEGSPTCQIAAVLEATAAEILTSRGFEWRLEVWARKQEKHAGVFLVCDLPQSLVVDGSALADGKATAGLVPVVMRVKVNRWRQGVREDPASLSWLGAAGMSWLGEYRGRRNLLPLRSPAATADGSDDSLARWAPYLHDGKMTGTITLLPL